jgi:Anaphase-promoting complex, subunit 10 (APC10)
MDVSIEENLDTIDKRELGNFLDVLPYIVIKMKLMLITMRLLIFLCRSGADAIFSISTAKPGNGVEQLRDDRYFTIY